MMVTCVGKRTRRRRRGGKAVEPADKPTPETVAKLKAPVWATWPSELQMAAAELDLAVRLLAGRLICQGRDPNHVDKEAKTEWSKGQERAVERYLRWYRLMLRLGWRVEPILAIVVHGREPAPDEVWRLRCALQLHATGQILAGSPRRNVGTIVGSATAA